MGLHFPTMLSLTPFSKEAPIVPVDVEMDLGEDLDEVLLFI